MMHFHRYREVFAMLSKSRRGLGKFPSKSAHMCANLRLSGAPLTVFSLARSRGRHFSTSSSPPQSSTSSSSSASPDTAPLAASILSKAKYHRVYDMLNLDQRVKIPQVDFFKICFENGLSTDEAKSLRTSLHDSGLILYFPRGSSEHSRLNDEIIIKPKEVSNAFMKALDVDHSYVNMYSIERRQQLEQLQAKLEPLQKHKDQLQYKAHRYADRCITASMVGLTGMSFGIVRLTFWDLSWDIMEPVTYMLNLFTMTTSLYFFALYGNEFAYPTLHERIVATRLGKYYRRYKFDIKEYERLTQKVAKIQEELKAPEMFYLRQLTNGNGASSSDQIGESTSSGTAPPVSNSPEKIAQS